VKGNGMDINLESDYEDESAPELVECDKCGKTGDIEAVCISPGRVNCRNDDLEEPEYQDLCASCRVDL
jgi:hypothetical protein